MGSQLTCNCMNERDSDCTTPMNDNYELHGCGGLSSRDSNDSTAYDSGSKRISKVCKKVSNNTNVSIMTRNSSPIKNQ